MKLYDAKRAPSPRRVHIFLAEKGIDDIERVPMDLAGGDNLAKDYRQKNPMGRVPMLELDDGTCIAETVAICRYFEETHPEPPLMGTDALDKTIVEMWQRRMEFNLLMPVGMAFRNLTGFFKDRETPVKQWGEVCLADAKKMFGFMDKHLANSEYVAGDAYTIADITALCAVDFAKVIELRIGEDQTHFKRWYDAVSSRPSAKAE